MVLSLKRSMFLSCVIMLFFLVSHSLSAQEKTITGRILCVSESETQVPCSSGSTRFALETDSGERYFFLPEDSKSRVFSDERVRDRKLEVRVLEKERRRVEIIKVFSIKDGKKYEIRYFCSVCNITAFVGGPCWCCQKEFEFQEVPVN